MAKILCVEDEPDLREQIVEELVDAGYEVLEAGNGVEGLAVIENGAPDLVLSDVNMPGMGGHELMKRVRDRHPELSDMPFLFLSAQADRAQVIEAKKMGADDYLTKPVDFELLLATLEARLAQVERMASHKEQQMVKLYRSLANEGTSAEPDEPQPPAAAAAAIAPAKSLRALLAAHENVDVDAIKSAFAAKGHECMVTNSGRAVIDRFSDIKADVILLAHNTVDLVAPLVAKRLRAMDVPLPPIILMVDSKRYVTEDIVTQNLFAIIVELPRPADEIAGMALTLAG